MRFKKYLVFVVLAGFVVACGGGSAKEKSKKQTQGNEGVSDPGKGTSGEDKGDKGGQEGGMARARKAGKYVMDKVKITPPPQAGALDKLLAGVDSKLDSKARGRRYGSRYAAYRRYRYRRGGGPKKADKTLAPYFHVPGSDKKGLEALPLKKTSASVQIAGVIAQAKVTQVYKNEGKKPIEAVYVFPASTRAAVHGMRMKIGSRILEARIKEKKKARQIYEKAKREGRRASLLEQERPNVFTMNVANIMPGDTIQVELDYSELLVPEDGVYEFVYPTVVGPRFAGGADPNKDKWMNNPHMKAGKKEPYEFDIDVHVESPIGIKALSSPSHPVDVKYASRTTADVTLKKKGGGNRDYVLKYRLAGDSIETGVLAFEGKKEKFFLLMMEPPKRVKKKAIPPREYIFVVDVSGSMFGFPLDTSKNVIKNLFKGMSSKDYFNVVLFAGASRVLSPKSLRATRANLEKVMGIIGRQRGGGGTQLLKGLKTAYKLPKVKKKGVSRSVVVITDGYVGVENQTFRFINKRLNEANLFSFGIGRSVNRALIEDMGRAGMGESFVVLSGAEATDKAQKFKEYIESPVLTDIQVKYDGMSVYDVVPKAFPDLMAQRPLIAFGKYTGETSGSITVTGATGGGSFKKTLTFGAGASKPKNKPLRVLWARKWVDKLSDQLKVLPSDPDLKGAITNVGLSYKLLTQFTSFVAVDLKQVKRNGKLVTVRQPLPMPKGVSNKAIGARRKTKLKASSASSGAPLQAFLGGSGSGGYGSGGARVRRRARARGSYSRSLSAPSPSHNPLGSLPSSADRAVRKQAEETEAKTTKSSAPTVSVSASNLKSVYRRTVVRAVKMLLRVRGRCLKGLSKAGKTVTLTVTVSSSGSFKITGGTGAIRRCVKKSVKAMITSLLKRKQVRKDSAKPVTIRIRIRW